MKLALVAPLPPLRTPFAELARDVALLLRERVSVECFVRDPEHVAAELVAALSPRPCADLPARIAEEDDLVPVFLVADGDHYAHQLRYVEKCPGVLVLLEPNLHGLLAMTTADSMDREGYRRLLLAEHGERARDWPERLERMDADRRRRARAKLRLRGLLAAASRAVIEPVEGARDAESLAGAIVEAVKSLPHLATPRVIEEDASARPVVEVVTVSYNSRNIIGPGLESVLRQDYPNLVVTVVDNASRDGTADYVRATFPSVNLIASYENLGFAGGNNLAFAKSRAKYVVLFNQDAVARRDWIHELVRVAERDEKIAAVGSKMMLYRCPTIFNSTGISMNRTGFCVDRQIGEKDDDPSPVPADVLGVCGGAMLVRTSVLRELGGFDDSFFMYFEDMDLSWRMWLAGYRIVYAPLAVVHHDWHGDLDDGKARQSEAESSARTERRRVLCERNRLQCMFRNYELATLVPVLRDAWRFDRVRLGWIDAAIDRGETPDYFRMVGRAIRDAWRWNLLRIPLHLLRRRRIQAHRKVSDDELRRLFSDWEGEPSFIGDLYAINDRFSAQKTDRIVMGRSDRGCLGPGWYAVEPLPDRDHGVRWTKRRAFAYLSSERPSACLVLRGAAGPLPVELKVTVGAHDLGRRTIPPGVETEVEFPFPEPLAAGVVHEVAIESSTFRPCEQGMGPDSRDLGFRVAEVSLR